MALKKTPGRPKFSCSPLGGRTPLGGGLGGAQQLLPSVDATLAWFAQRGVRALNCDSRRVRRGDAFVAWPGHVVDGRRFVGAALEAGAVACLVEAQGVDGFDFEADPRVAALDGLKAATGPIASRFMGEPSARLHVVACTGTNGKTSMAWWLAQGLSGLGRRCGVVGTLGIGEPPRGRAPQREESRDRRAEGAETLRTGAVGDPARPARPVLGIEPTGLTTPDPVTLQAALRRFADAGFSACAIEASSIGLVEHRLAGTHIEVALFSNFTQDHLDFHGSMAAYWAAKAQLFAWPGLRAAVVNLDDAHGRTLAADLAATPIDTWTYSTRIAARLRASDIAHAEGGLSFQVHEAGFAAAVSTGLIGAYNVSNLLAVIGALRCLGVSLADAARACGRLTPVPGRMQRVDVRLAQDRGGMAEDAAPGAPSVERAAPAIGSTQPGALPEVVVDYAHTPDALEKALLALQPFAAARGGKLWCVFGCGGNRDAGKRPLMGALAQALAQQVVLTSDNPRTEAPAFILLQIVAGLAGNQQRVKVIEDRRAAIAHAVRHAAARDVILIAGKGHEDYQEIGGVKHPFSDVAEARVALQRRAGDSP